MSFKTRFIKFNETVKPWAALIAMYSGIVVAGGAVWTWIVKPKDLAVYIEKEQVNFPASINDRFERVYNYLTDSCRNFSVDSDAKATYEYLQNTNNFWVITIHNQTDHSVKGIGVRVAGVTSLGSSAVNGGFLTDSEKVSLMRSIHFDKDSKVVYLDRIDILQPKSDIKIFLWGKMADLALWSNLFINYDGGDARAGEEITVFGFKAFLCEYLYELLFLLCLLFGFVYWTKVKRPGIVYP